MHVRLGGTDHTVVGVMPEDFGFPVNHRLWTPLRSDPTNDVPDQGPEVFVFARLAAGATLKGAQAELTTVGPTPTDVPDTGESLQPRLLPYRDARIPPLPFGDRIIRFLVTLLLIPPLANIAILVYARTVTRGEEFAARYALGASRGRLIGQLFVEALVLAAGAAGVALVLLRLWMLHELSISNSIQPFWFDLGFSYMTILFAGGLAVIAALIVGVVPAHRATGRLVQTGLRALDSRTGIQLGAMWTVLVVAQIGFSVAALPVAFEMTWGVAPARHPGTRIRARGGPDRPTHDGWGDSAGRRGRPEPVRLPVHAILRSRSLVSSPTQAHFLPALLTNSHR